MIERGRDREGDRERERYREIQRRRGSGTGREGYIERERAERGRTERQIEERN